MGFRTGAYARIWSIDNMGKYSIANISISKKNKETEKYDVEFSDKYVRLVGTAHTEAQHLGLPTSEEFENSSTPHRGTTIRISSCDVTNKYVAEKERKYVNYVIFGFEIPENSYSSKSENTSDKKKSGIISLKKDSEDDLSSEDSFMDDDELPF